MLAERDVTRIVRSWLRRDEHESADRVLDNVFDLLDATPQRRSWWPAWRLSDMNTFAKLALGAAAVVVVAFVGINLLPRAGGVGGPASTASPTPSPAPTLEPTTSPEPAAAFPPVGELAAGTPYAMTLAGKAFSLSFPTSGWVSNGSWGIDKGYLDPAGGSFIFWSRTPDGVFSDPCGHVESPFVDRSVAALAAALTTIPGTDLVSGPTDMTVGGYPAKHVVLTIREDLACGVGSDAGMHIWYDDVHGARWPDQKGATLSVWITDVDGATVWIDGQTFKGAGPEAAQEMQQIIDSIQFE